MRIQNSSTKLQSLEKLQNSHITLQNSNNSLQNSVIKIKNSPKICIIVLKIAKLSYE